MNRANPDLVLLIHYSPGSDSEEEFILRLVSNSVRTENFLRNHELVRRNYITRKQSRLLDVWRRKRLPGFHFLIGLN